MFYIVLYKALNIYLKNELHLLIVVDSIFNLVSIVSNKLNLIEIKIRQLRIRPITRGVAKFKHK